VISFSSPFCSSMLKHVLTDLVEIRRLGTSQETENQDFRRYLSAHHHPVEPFQILATEIQRQVDCTACANCCRYSTVIVGQSEIETIARHLRYETEQVRRQYTIADPEGLATRVLKSTPQGCIFLDGNLCTIYEARPKACRDFPHIALGTRSLGGRFSSLCRWYSLCPIIYNALESYKRLVGYRRSVHGA
jgi:uncharacterized protein